jgi:hypothetical protein
MSPSAPPLQIKNRARIADPINEKSALLRNRDDVDDLTTSSVTEFDGTCREGEECVVLTDSYILSWVELGATLTDEDLAAIDYLSTESLDSKVLRIGITTVTC